MKEVKLLRFYGDKKGIFLQDVDWETDTQRTTFIPRQLAIKLLGELKEAINESQ